MFLSYLLRLINLNERRVKFESRGEKSEALFYFKHSNE